MNGMSVSERLTAATGKGEGSALARSVRGAVRRNAPGYLFLAPWLIGFLCLTLGPALMSLYLSFTDFDLLQAPNFVGMQDYVRMATADPKFFAALRVTFLYVALSVPLKLAFALAVAM